MSNKGKTYMESETYVPRWFVWLGMIVALLSPYIMAFVVIALLSGNILLYFLSDILGLIIALLAVPIISLIIIAYAYLWYARDAYWYKDAENTILNVLALLFIIGYPIAFVISLNTSMGVYFVGAYLLVIFVASYLYRWQPRVSTRMGYKFALFWAGVAVVVVTTITGMDIYINHGLNALITAMSPLVWYKYVMPYAMAPFLAERMGFTNALQIIPTIGLMAFVVGFSEEGWARMSIPLLARYFDNNIMLSVWWLGTTWISLHAVVIAIAVAEFGGLLGVISAFLVIPIELIILSVISVFIFYVFAKTGDYVSAALAHGFYDMLVSLGAIGLIVGIAFIIIYWKYRHVS
jgi:hypothetical protein